MNNLFNDDHSLTEEGRQFLITFNATVKHIMNSDAVIDMSEKELETLRDVLISIIHTATDNQIIDKRKSANEFSAMTDEDFEKYLQEKYGKVWMFCTLTTEEMARVTPIAQKQVKDILTKSAENLTYLPPKPGVRIPSGSIWDPKPGPRYK